MALVTMYKPDGTEMQVGGPQVSDFLAMGWSMTKAEPVAKPHKPEPKPEPKKEPPSRPVFKKKG